MSFWVTYAFVLCEHKIDFFSTCQELTKYKLFKAIVTESGYLRQRERVMLQHRFHSFPVYMH
jgi:hypothetical protein